MIARTESPLGQLALRGLAILLSLIPLALWVMWGMVPVAGDRWAKLPMLVWFAYLPELILIGVASWMYWWSFYERPNAVELPIHAQLFRIYVVGFVSLSTLYVLISAGQYLFLRH
jgi:hypothetical protein